MAGAGHGHREPKMRIMATRRQNKEGMQMVTESIMSRCVMHTGDNDLRSISVYPIRVAFRLNNHPAPQRWGVESRGGILKYSWLEAALGSACLHSGNSATLTSMMDWIKAKMFQSLVTPA